MSIDTKLEGPWAVRPMWNGLPVQERIFDTWTEASIEAAECWSSQIKTVNGYGVPPYHGMSIEIVRLPAEEEAYRQFKE